MEETCHGFSSIDGGTGVSASRSFLRRRGCGSSNPAAIRPPTRTLSPLKRSSGAERAASRWGNWVLPRRCLAAGERFARQNLHSNSMARLRVEECCLLYIHHFKFDVHNMDGMSPPRLVQRGGARVATLAATLMARFDPTRRARLALACARASARSSVYLQVESTLRRTRPCYLYGWQLLRSHTRS